MLLLLQKTLKGSRNIQDFALIRSVVFTFIFKFSCKYATIIEGVILTIAAPT